MDLIPVILCGGAGSRLWPVSRELHPKPFIRLADGQSLLQKAFLRGAALPGAKEILTVTNRELFFKTEDEFREVNAAKLATSFILEPFGRNTSAAIAAAALHVSKAHGPDTLMLVLAADHLIADQVAFAEAVVLATELAHQGSLVTFGIQPDAPETGYGYIEAQGSKVLRFVEKPSLEKAQEYLASGSFLWNSGMFCFKASSMLEAMAQHCPDILSATKACIAQSRMATGKAFAELTLEAESFAKIPDISIDYSVMEPSTDVTVVPCSIGWSDIGSWSALGDLSPPDASGNRIEVNPGGSLSLQTHHHRSKQWIVVSGIARVVNGDEETFARTNESIYMPASFKRQLENPGLLNLVTIEAQSSDYLGEDDIMRCEDNYACT